MNGFMNGLFKDSNNYKEIKSGIICMAASVLLIFLDQFTKALAVTNLKNQGPVILIKNVFQLRYLENHGAAFGILQGKKLFFIIMTIVFLAFLVFAFLRLPNEKKFNWLKLIVVLFFSGAIGNFIDRVSMNYVVDFFYFNLINFPIFNVADIYVTLAAGLFIVLFLFYYKEEDLNKILPDRKNHSK